LQSVSGTTNGFGLQIQRDDLAAAAAGLACRPTSAFAGGSIASRRQPRFSLLLTRMFSD
jgi:hypothetical protein